MDPDKTAHNMIAILLFLSVFQSTRMYAFSYFNQNLGKLQGQNTRIFSTVLKATTTTYEKRSAIETLGAASVASAAAVAAAAVIFSKSEFAKFKIY